MWRFCEYPDCSNSFTVKHDTMSWGLHPIEQVFDNTIVFRTGVPVYGCSGWASPHTPFSRERGAYTARRREIPKPLVSIAYAALVQSFMFALTSTFYLATSWTERSPVELLVKIFMCADKKKEPRFCAALGKRECVSRPTILPSAFVPTLPRR